MRLGAVQSATAVAPSANVTTCGEARSLSEKVGVRVLWRPRGVVNWTTPELDAAEVLED